MLRCFGAVFSVLQLRLLLNIPLGFYGSSTCRVYKRTLCLAQNFASSLGNEMNVEMRSYRQEPWFQNELMMRIGRYRRAGM